MSDNVQQHNMDEANEEDASSSTTGKQRSDVWEYFKRLPLGPDGIGKASCNSCGIVYKANAKSGTSNMKRDIPKCFIIEETAPPQKKIHLDNAIYREKMTIAIIKHNYPFSYVEHDATRELRKFLHPCTKPITRNTTKADVLRIFEREKATVKKHLEKITSRICLTSDLWSSIMTDGYMSMTAHYVDENWVLRKKVLNFRVISPPHSGPILAEYMMNFLTNWGIEKKVVTITLDNASYNNVFVESLKDHFRLNDALVCDGDFTHVRCGAHVLNIIVQAGLKKIEGSIEKVREPAKYVRGSVSRKIKFAECNVQISKKSGRHVRQDIVARWNSTYLMLECELKYRRAYTRLQLVDSKFITCPTHEEWTRIKEITRFLKPFYDMTTLFSGSSYPTSDLYFHNVAKIQLLIQEEMCNPDPIISFMAKDMNVKFDKYWETYSMVLSFAVILDPRYKLKIIEFWFSKLGLNDNILRAKVDDVSKGLKKLYNEYEVHPNVMRDSTIMESSNVRDEDTLDDLEGFESFQSKFVKLEKEKSQLDQYLLELPLDRYQKIDILQFWKDNQGRYPDLALMACDILSIQITSVASESCFSIGGQIINKYRSSLLSTNAETLLLTRDWLFGLENEDKIHEEELIEDVEALISTLRQ